MQKLLAFAGIIALLSACAGLSRTDQSPAPDQVSGGYASPTAASFMGFHGPLHRLNRNDNQGPP